MSTGYDVDFLGCKISHTDAQAISDALAAAGHRQLPGTTPEQASNPDVRVINTCCITGEAEKKSRQRVRRAVNATGVDGRVFVTGCGASNGAERYEQIDDRVTVLPGAASRAASAIVEAADHLAGLACRGPAPGVAPGHDTRDGRATKRTRAFVKVQDGCDFDCSYCIVPIVRGAPRSRSVDAVLAEVAKRVEQGRREIVLTGVNIGLYRDPESRAGLDRLLLAVADTPGVARVRISSIESNHVNRRLVATMAAHPKVCHHLHVPLQSGDDDVLADMGRHYDARRYMRAIATARAAMPDLNVTTDVIVGYPSETDASFERTLALVTELGFTKVHAFPFSERPGTDAAQHRDPIARDVKSERSRRLREQAEHAAIEHRTRMVGRRDEVVVESRGGGALLTSDPDTDRTVASELGHRTGYTRDYSPVRLLGLPPDTTSGSIVDVLLERVHPETGVLDARYAGPGGG
ncbi:MAG: modification enzyme MiaB family [Thermoleophilia bacterium]|nr:modification enzyme MiaB family [Thermoleophilia bacterium]